MAATDPGELFWWTIESLSVDGLTGDPRSYADRGPDEVLGRGLYGVLRAHLDRRVAKLPGSGMTSWIVPRAYLLQQWPTRADLERWHRTSRVHITCATCTPKGGPSLQVLIQEAKQVRSGRRS